MKIDEAIKYNQDFIAQPWLEPFPDYIDAIKLGNEALKRMLDVRRFPEASNWKPLPSETED